MFAEIYSGVHIVWCLDSGTAFITSIGNQSLSLTQTCTFETLPYTQRSKGEILAKRRVNNKTHETKSICRNIINDLKYKVRKET
jgi:replication fork clamp-binding protein CrfC